MLLNLAIQGYAVVDRLEVDLHPGMTSITGETGAGKSIMLDALGLPLLMALADGGPAYICVSLVASLMVIWRHRSNIKRLLAGTEPRLGQKA